MEWAATELFKATNKRQYYLDAKNMLKLTGETFLDSKDASAHYQFYPFLNIAHYELYSLADPIFKKKLAGYYKNGIISNQASFR